MVDHYETRLYYRPLPKATVVACGVIIVTISILALIGWFHDVPRLQGLVPGSPPMPYLSSLGFLIAGTGLLALSRGYNRFTMFCGLPLALGAGYLLTEYSLWAGLGRMPLLEDLPLPSGITQTSQQSPVISLGLCMSGAALLRLPYILKSRAGTRELDMVTGFLFGVACAGIVAYQTADTVDGGWTSMFAMPVTVAGCFMLIALALHAASPHPGMRAYERSELRLPVIITVGVAGVSLGVWAVLVLSGLNTLTSSLTVVGFMVSIPLVSQFIETWLRRMLIPEPVNTEGSFRALVESMAEGVLVCNRKGQVTLTNAAIRELLGLQPLAHQNQRLGLASDVSYQLFQLESQTPIPWDASPLHIALAGKEVTGLEVLTAGDAMTRRSLRVNTRPVKSAGDKLIGAILTATDISSQKRDELAVKRYTEVMARTSREFEQVANITAHHLQEPVRNIISYAQLLEREIAPTASERSKEYLNYLVQGGQRIKDQLTDLLYYLDMGSRRLTIRPVSMQEVVEECVSALAPENWSVVKVLSPPMPTVMGDHELLVVLVGHLLNNALKFNKSAIPRIEIASQQSGDQWQFSVADNGIGIRPEHSAKIFDMFQRLHLQEQFTGTGMGLALCRKIVTLHGGTIWYEPNDGEGSRFCFRLPMTP